MRVTSTIWVSALRKREEAKGAFVSLSKKGNAEAGAIFVIHYILGEAYSLYSPLPQMFFDEDHDGERQFEKRFDQVDNFEITEWLEKQKKMDDDFWVVEIESSEKQPSIEVIEV